MPEVIEKSLSVLIAARVDDILVLRRLLRDTSYRVDPATSATQALRAISMHSYSAVVADDDALVGISGSKLLSSVEELQPTALRILIARRERRPQLANAALQKKYQLFVRPYFAAPVRDALLAHERSSKVASGPRHSAERRDTPGAVVTGAAMLEEDTKPYTLVSGGAVVRRRLLLTMAEVAEGGVAQGDGWCVGHAARVSSLATALGRAIGLQPGDLDALDEAALLHDVGELGPHMSLLRARRRLTPQELRAVHAHPGESALVAERCGLPKPAVAAVRHHHERWDGKGYPDRLARSQIPVLARILAVADTWDAMATQRPYRAQMPTVQCARALRLAAGAQLDPALVELFLQRKLYEHAQPATLRNAAIV
jgi:HD-GYP domain-containing protein (c-di-GMP phosphodiesterase class II)